MAKSYKNRLDASLRDQKREVESKWGFNMDALKGIQEERDRADVYSANKKREREHRANNPRDLSRVQRQKTKDQKAQVRNGALSKKNENEPKTGVSSVIEGMLAKDTEPTAETTEAKVQSVREERASVSEQKTAAEKAWDQYVKELATRREKDAEHTKNILETNEDGRNGMC